MTSHQQPGVFSPRLSVVHAPLVMPPTPLPLVLGLAAGRSSSRASPTPQAREARRAQVRSRQVDPEVGPPSAFYGCIPTGMHEPTCFFWANLTPFSLQALAAREVEMQALKARMRTASSNRPTYKRPVVAGTGPGPSGVVMHP